MYLQRLGIAIAHILVPKAGQFRDSLIYQDRFQNVVSRIGIGIKSGNLFTSFKIEYVLYSLATCLIFCYWWRSGAIGS